MHASRLSLQRGRTRRVRLAVLCACAAGAVLPLSSQGARPPGPYVPESLQQAAAADPTALFKVIVQGRDDTRAVVTDVGEAQAGNPGRGRGIGRRFRAIAGVSAELTGRQVLALTHRPRVLAITPDVRLAPAGAPVNLTLPIVAGLAQADQTLTALHGNWTGLGQISYVYQWQRCDGAGAGCADIAAATGSTYTAGPDDVGATLRVSVTAGDDGGSIASAVSAASDVLVAAPSPVTVAPPAIAAPPVLSGSPRDGEVLTASSGSWSDASSFAYRWQRCGGADDRSGAVLDSAPIGFWRLRDVGGGAVDAAGSGRSGSYVGGVLPGPDGITLDGTTGAVDVSGFPTSAFSAGFSLEAWVKLDGKAANAGIVGDSSWNGGALLWVDDSGYYGLAVSNSASDYLTTDVTPAVGSWEHLTATWDGTTLSLYRNGTLIGSRPFAGNPGTPNADLLIGDYAGSGHHLGGLVADVAVYDHALSPAEVDGHAAGSGRCPLGYRDGRAGPRPVGHARDVDGDGSAHLCLPVATL